MKAFARVWLAATLMILTACATDRPQPALDPRLLLSLSGFTMKIADSPEALEQLSRVPQKQLLRYTTANPPMFIWVDAKDCRCWYEGDEAAYLRLVQMGWGGEAREH